MSDNLPAIPEPREVATVDVDSWIPVARDVINLANVIMDTDFVPDNLRGSGPAVAAAMLYGREAGLMPMTALNMVDVVKGKPSINSEAMRMLILAAGHELEFVESTHAKCTIRGRRRGSSTWTSVTWTVDDAKRAGLHGDAWTKYTRRMLQARASSEIGEMLFPDVIHGFRSTEVMLDEEGPADDTAAAPRTTVKRVRKTAAKPTPPTPVDERPDTPAGPPLPGEDGYQTTGGEGTPGAVLDPVPDPEGLPPSPPVQTPAPARGGADAGEEGPPGGEGFGEGPKPPGGPAEDPAEHNPKGARLLNRAQQRAIEASLTDLGVDPDRDERHLVVATILGRHVDTMTTVTFDEASTLLDTFAMLETKEQLTALLDRYDVARAANLAATQGGEA